MDKFKGLVKKHKNSLYVNVDKDKMIALAKKERNKPVKLDKKNSQWSFNKANKVRCEHCSMCGGCGLKLG